MLRGDVSNDFAYYLKARGTDRHFPVILRVGNTSDYTATYIYCSLSSISLPFYAVSEITTAVQKSRVTGNFNFNFFRLL
jgi:hypothetical protein